ncbi:hypothetical protein P4640_27755 [Priestia aryabhattai]|uniref:hypothetical protein n=1 Tax=Priestia aryabhattai TaxID=412384 RepID=UPI002E1EAB27|nr:hypothetical protein [Priestia aryabhattai]
MYKYANKHFNQHEKDAIWRDINNDADVQRKFNSCRSSIDMTREIAPKDRIREDFVEIEKALAEIEIAFKRIEKLPNNFSFNDNDILKFKEQFRKFEEEASKLNMQRIGWN